MTEKCFAGVWVLWSNGYKMLENQWIQLLRTVNIMPPRQCKSGRGASATSAAAASKKRVNTASKKVVNAKSKKNAKPLSVAMSSDEASERQHEEVPIRGVTPPEDPNEVLPTMETRGKKQRKDCRIQDRAARDG